MTYSSVLIANRGEIAVRLVRACHDEGLDAIAVYSDAARDAPHVRDADKAIHIGPAEATASYLDGDALIMAALTTGADAIHPGYGFLAENADFAQACIDAGLTFVGPKPKIIRQMGSKIAAKSAAEAAGIPVVPGYHGADQDPERLAAAAAARADTDANGRVCGVGGVGPCPLLRAATQGDIGARAACCRGSDCVHRVRTAGAARSS